MGKVVLITGASAGIGQAAAAALASSGWTVVGASRRGTAGEGWEGLMMDVDQDQPVEDGVAEVLRRHGRLDAIVTCAGWGLGGPVELTLMAEARAQLETNFWGTVRAVRAALPALRAAGGRIVLLSSVGGVVALPYQGFYSASKFAVEALGEALGYEVEPHGVRVTIVQPGNVKTDFTANRRVSPVAPPYEPYQGPMKKAIEVMEHDEVNGAPVADVATLIVKVLSARHPPRRASVGKASERMGIWGKKVLPFGLFRAAAKGSLGV